MKMSHFVSALLVSVLAATLHAESIGVNMVGVDAKAGTLAATDSAGVAAVAQDHWNNLTVSNDDANGHNNSGSLASVKDNAGKEVKDAAVTVDAKPDGQIFPADGASWGFSGANLTLQTGEIHPRPSITVKGIPYKKYDVYVYFSAGANGGQGSGKISVANNAAGKVDATGTYFYNFNWQGGNYVKSEAKTLDAAKASKGSNYICFTGNTARDIAVEANGTLGGGWSGVAAIQIVQVSDSK